MYYDHLQKIETAAKKLAIDSAGRGFYNKHTK